VNIEYVGEQAGWHTFRWLSDGERPVLAIYVNENDPELVIWIGDVRASQVPDFLAFAQPTKGRAHIHPLLDENGVRRVVCPASVVEYIFPKICTMMARVYVPAETVVLS